jgi:hypothetical protein
MESLAAPFLKVSSQAALSREYSQKGFSSGVSSVIHGVSEGFLYAEQVLMKT